MPSSISVRARASSSPSTGARSGRRAPARPASRQAADPGLVEGAIEVGLCFGQARGRLAQLADALAHGLGGRGRRALRNHHDPSLGDLARGEAGGRGRGRYAVVVAEAGDRSDGAEPEALVFRAPAAVAQDLVRFLRLAEVRGIAADVGMERLRDLVPALLDRLFGGERRYAEHAIDVGAPPLLDRREQHARAVAHVLRRDAAAAPRPADLPVVRRAPPARDFVEQMVEEHRLVVRTAEQLLEAGGVENAHEPFECRAPASGF